MLHRNALFVAAALLPAVLYCQQRANRVSFEVASVKVVPFEGPGAVEETPERVRYRTILPGLIMRAYEIKPYQLQNVPFLAGTNLLYDIQATLPPGARMSDIPAMLRSLLEDRFRLSAHWEERLMQVYKLEVDPSGLKLKRLELGERPSGRPLQIHALRQGLVKFRGVATLQQFVEFLSPGMNHPVVDRTGTAGLFHISLDARVPALDIDLSGLPVFAGRSHGGPDDAGAPKDISINGDTLYGNAPDLGAALNKLGLRLDKGKENIKVLVVDSVNKTPTPN